MLEAAIPALWSTVHGWFTPAVLFLVLNLVIGTIAVTSKVTAAASATGDGEGDGDAAGGQNRKLSRLPSMALDRLRSFNLSRLAAPAPEAPVTGVLDLGSDEHLPRLENEEEEEDRGEIVEHDHEDEHAHADAQARAQMERSRSEAAAEADLPPLPARMRKSASEMSAFAHFAAEEDIETVEARRPATTRDVAAARREETVSEEETEEAAAAAAAGEVDARADDFINKFRHQLKLQRIDSFLRYRDMLRRGQAAAAAAAAGTE